MDTLQLTEARRALIERYVRGEIPRTPSRTGPIHRRSPESPPPLSFGQEHLWFLYQLARDSPVYTVPCVVRIRGRVSVDVLRQSFNTLLQRHESLRATFPTVDGQPIQVIAPVLTVPMPTIDLRTLPAQARTAAAQRLAAEEARRPFDLATGPLVRVTLLRLTDEEQLLLLTLHHIVADDWSVGVLLRELSALYGAGSGLDAAPLPPQPIQYADFAAWQRQWLRGSTLEDQITYWKEQLAGAPAMLALPTDRPRPAVQSFRGEMQALVVSPALSQALKTLSHRTGVTLFMTLLAAFATLMYRYSGQDDVVIGSPVAGRTRTETENAIGLFINTLALRVDLSGDPPFRELLARVREVTLGAHAHQDIPFGHLVEVLQPERDPSRNPVFQALLTLEPPSPPLPPAWTIAETHTSTGTCKVDLSLELEDRPDGLLGRFEYSSDLFEPATISRLLDHWRTLLEGIVADPEQRLSDLPILTPRERHQLLVEWNTTRTDYPRDACVHTLFESQVERTPEAIAIVCEHEQLTYADLNRRANQLAHHLRRLGVGPEVAVGLCMDRSAEMVVGLLGILKAGGYYVPLDPAYPKSRLDFMLQDTQAPVLLTQTRALAALPPHGAHVLCLDGTSSGIAQGPAENLPSRTTATNLAYVMYTSGSSGKPKGVQVQHRNIVRLLFGADYARLDATRTILHMAPISFDASTFELWGALLHGARCVLLPARVPSAADIRDAVRTHHVTTMWLTASLFNMVIDEAPDALQGVEQVLTGGESLSVAHIRRALDLLPSTQLINGYGPTEGTTFTCCHPIPRRLDAAARSIPIGRPIGQTQVYILDHDMHPTPIGVPGQLYIGGDGLARGYLNRPDLTRDSFVANPFSDEPEARLYKSGDIARYRPDGTIEFVGRADTQVKIRGFRVELGEIETVLAQHPAVQEALVLHRDDGPGGRRLVAYIVPRAGQRAEVSRLRSFLREYVPEYMIPPIFVEMAALPRDPNGKLDRHALPPPGAAHLEPDELGVMPRTAREHVLAQIWAEILGQERVGVFANFFELGGDSIKSIQVIARAEQAGLQLRPEQMFEYQTVAELAAAAKVVPALGSSIQDGAAARHGGDAEAAIVTPVPPGVEACAAVAVLGQVDAGVRAPLLVVNPGGSRPPFLFVDVSPDAVGLYCLRIAQHLGPDQPVYILEMYAQQGAPPTLEAMVSDQLRLLHALPLGAPRLIGGYCAGGLVAYELARQLRAEGRPVDLLLIIDPPKASPGRIRPRLLHSLISRTSALTGQGPERQLEWFLLVRHLALALRRQYRRSVHRPVSPADRSPYRRGGRSKAGQKRRLVPPLHHGVRRLAQPSWRDRAFGALVRLRALMPGIDVLRRDSGAIYDWMTARYVLRPYDGKVTLLRADEELGSSAVDLTAGWGALAREVEVHRIPGTHVTMRTEHVNTLATFVEACLVQAQGAGTAPAPGSSATSSVQR